MKGKIFTVLMRKGGTGKTTFATNLAASLAAKGKKVVAVDCDKNHAFAEWAKNREITIQTLEESGHDPKEIPAFIHCDSRNPEENMARVLNHISQEYDYVIVDTAGYDTVAAKTACRVSDQIIVPCIPDAVNWAQLPPTLQLVSETNDFLTDAMNAAAENAQEVQDYYVPTTIVLTAVAHHSRDLAQECKEYIVENNLTNIASVSSINISASKEFPKCYSLGLGIVDTGHKNRSQFDMLIDEFEGLRKPCLPHQVSNKVLEV